MRFNKKVFHGPYKYNIMSNFWVFLFNYLFETNFAKLHHQIKYLWQYFISSFFYFVKTSNKYSYKNLVTVNKLLFSLPPPPLRSWLNYYKFVTYNQMQYCIKLCCILINMQLCYNKQCVIKIPSNLFYIFEKMFKNSTKSIKI